MTRDEISKEAYQLGIVFKNMANASYGTPKEPKLMSIVGQCDSLSNDSCEPRHSKKSLIKRLKSLSRKLQT